MKKQYINPTMEVVNIRIENQILAGSKFGSQYTGGIPESRRGRFYEDDEE